MGHGVFSGTYIYLLPAGLSKNEVFSNLKLIRDHGGVTVADPMVDYLTHVVVRVPAGIPRRRNLERPVRPARLPNHPKDWDFDLLVSNFTLHDGAARKDSRGRDRSVAVVQEPWLRESIDEGHPLEDADNYGGWLVRGVSSKPNQPPSGVERDPRKRRQSALAATSPTDPQGSSAPIDLRDNRPTWGDYNARRSPERERRARSPPRSRGSDSGWGRRESDTRRESVTRRESDTRSVARSASSSVAGDAPAPPSEGRVMTLRQRLNRDFFEHPRPAEREHQRTHSPPEDPPSNTAQGAQSLSLAQILPNSGQHSPSLIDRLDIDTAAYAPDLLRGLEQSPGLHPMQLDRLGDRQAPPLAPTAQANEASAAPATAPSLAPENAITHVAHASPAPGAAPVQKVSPPAPPAQKRKRVTIISTIKTEPVDFTSPPAHQSPTFPTTFPPTPNSPPTQAAGPPEQPMSRTDGSSRAPAHAPGAAGSAGSNGLKLRRYSRSRSPPSRPAEARSAQSSSSSSAQSSSSSSASLSAAPPSPPPQPAPAPQPQAGTRTRPPAAPTRTQPPTSVSSVAAAPPPPPPAAFTTSTVSASTSAAPSVTSSVPASAPAPPPTLTAPSLTAPATSAPPSASLVPSSNRTGVFARHQDLPLDFFVEDNDKGDGEGVKEVITGSGGGVLAPANKARHVVLLLQKDQAPQTQWQRDMVAKKGAHPCARQLLDPMSYLVPASAPAPRARSPSVASADTPLSRKRARAQPAPEPEPEESDSEYDERSDDDDELGGVSERDSRNVASLIATLKQWDGNGGKMVFIQHCGVPNAINLYKRHKVFINARVPGLELYSRPGRKKKRV